MKLDKLELTQLGIPPKEVPCNDGSVQTVVGKELPCADRGGVKGSKGDKFETGGFKGSKPLADLPLVRDLIQTTKKDPTVTAVVSKDVTQGKKPNYLMIGLVILGGYLVYTRLKK